MGFGLGDILQTLQQGVQAMNNLTSKIGTIFPQVTGTSATPPSVAGSLTFSSSQPAMFVLTTTSSGFTGKSPIYPQ